MISRVAAWARTNITTRNTFPLTRKLLALLADP